jgi:biopolymer transport protein TolR
MSIDSKSAQGSVRSEINVTPLVDVCLVLLIIFMVVAPILHAGVQVDLPKTVKVPSLPPEQTQLTVSIKEDGSVYVENSRVEDSALRGLVAGIHAAEPERDVIVRGDRRLQYDKVCEVLALLSEVGFTRIGLVTEKRPAV